MLNLEYKKGIYSKQNLAFAEFLCSKTWLKDGFSLQANNGLVNKYFPGDQEKEKEFDLLSALHLPEDQFDFELGHHKLLCALWYNWLFELIRWKE